jgi:hypothetical protein
MTLAPSAHLPRAQVPGSAGERGFIEITASRLQFSTNTKASARREDMLYLGRCLEGGEARLMQ